MSVATAKKNVKEMFNLSDVLAGAASAKEEKSSKSKTPVLNVPEDIKKLATKVREVKTELDTFESQYETLSAEFIEKVSPLRENLCKTGYVSSVRVPDTKGLSVGLSWADKYSKIDASNETALKETVGVRFNDYFKTEMTITVKDMSEEALTEIVKAIGPDRFALLFSVEKFIKPTPLYTQQMFNLSAEQRCKLAAASVKQFKPSVKVK